MIRVLVTGVGDSLGIAVIKSLRNFENIELYVADADELAAGFFVSGVNKKTVFPYASSNEYKSYLLNFCKQNEIDVLIPGSEAEILKIARFKNEIVNTNILIPNHEVLKKALYKDLTVSLARNLNIEHPKTKIITKDNFSKKDILNEFDFPIIIKPSRSQGGKGVKHIYNNLDLDYHVKNNLNNYNKCLIQELIPGEIGSMYLFASVVSKDHELKTAFVSKSIKTKFKWGGPALAGITTRNKKIINLGKKIVNSLEKWVGPIMIEFMLDPRDNKFKLIEINPRLWGYNYLATGAGINFSKIIVDLALGRRISYYDEFEENKVLMRIPNDKILNKSDID
ncbi:MAG: ATP-grasp domain-containing protein [bacterium]